jgi:hypothetical protein
MHFHDLKQKFNQLVIANASWNLENCCFGCMEGILFGYIVSQNGIRIDPAKIERVKNIPFHKTNK